MRTPFTLLLYVFLFCSYVCPADNKSRMKYSIKAELTKINSLLKSEQYNASMAQTLQAAYYKNEGQTAPPFLEPGDDTATKRKLVKEEKIATNIAGFYALECGIELLTAQTNKTPVELLNEIVKNKINSASINILNRFANAAWKAGQPFRGLNRIERSTFSGFNFLPGYEVKKDYDMYKTAAAKLLPAMQNLAGSDINKQMQRIRELMQDENFAIAMADSLHVGYYKREQQKAPPFLTKEDDTATVLKSVMEEKIAISVGGFYALECGLNFFAAKNILPSQILKSIVEGTISNNDKMLMERFANVTWKAAQPFRSLERIKRNNFIPFYFLDEKEIDKDWVQIKAAAEKLLKDISS